MVCPSVRLSVGLSVCLSVCASVFLSFYLMQYLIWYVSNSCWTTLKIFACVCSMPGASAASDHHKHSSRNLPVKIKDKQTNKPQTVNVAKTQSWSHELRTALLFSSSLQIQVAFCSDIFPWQPPLAASICWNAMGKRRPHKHQALKEWIHWGQQAGTDLLPWMKSSQGTEQFRTNPCSRTKSIASSTDAIAIHTSTRWWQWWRWRERTRCFAAWAVKAWNGLDAQMKWDIR